MHHPCGLTFASDSGGPHFPQWMQAKHLGMEPASSASLRVDAKPTAPCYSRSATGFIMMARIGCAKPTTAHTPAMTMSTGKMALSPPTSDAE